MTIDETWNVSQVCVSPCIWATVIFPVRSEFSVCVAEASTVCWVFLKGLLRCHSHTVQLTHSKWTIQWLSNIQSCAPTVTGNFRAFITPKVSPIPFSAISPPQAPGSRSPASSLYRVVCSARFLHGLACRSVLCDWLPSRSRRFQVHLWVACISTSFLTMAE